MSDSSIDVASSADLWERFTKYSYTDRELGLTVDVSRVRFQESDLAPVLALFPAAFTAMGALEAGSIANKDEGRMVGHYWLRAPERSPTPEIEAEIRDSLAAVQSFAAKIHSRSIKASGGAFTHVLNIGIGGSALGPQFVAAALGSPDDKLQLRFIDNTDPAGIDAVLAELDPHLATTLVTVVSKSGGTPETRNGMLEVAAAYAARGLSFSAHAVAVTQPGSKLDKTATAEGWLARFPMSDWIGGRTSVTSTVGLVPAALQGLDVESFLAGAAEMDELTRRPSVWENPAALLALMWHHLGGGMGKKDMVLLPYKDRLALFSRYLQQLVMESLGKEHNRKGQRVCQGIAVYGNKGSTDQHAYVQQLRDGLNNFFVTFIEVLEDRAGESMEVEPGITSGDYLHGFLRGTRTALYESGRDSITITVPTVDARRVGALIALYERAVGLYGELVDLNAYHQPGVEAGKKAAATILDLQLAVVAALKKQGAPATAAEIAAAMGRAADVEEVFKILEHLSANATRKVARDVTLSPTMDRFSAT